MLVSHPLQKLSRAAKVLYNNNINEMLKSPFIYELCCAYQKSLEIEKDVLVWSDINPNTKDSLGLPQEDVGIDYMDEECTFAGQAKLYDKTLYVKACDIDRTRLCAYRARKYSGKNIFPCVEVVTPENIKLGRCKIEMDDVIHSILSKKEMREMCKKAISLPEQEEFDSKNMGNVSSELRECQLQAIECIGPNKINRIRMACGSGKTRVALEVIKRSAGLYLVLVPYIILMEQWGDYLKRAGVKVCMVGTGYNGKIPLRKEGETIVVICVYPSFEKAFFIYKDDKRYQKNFACIIVDEAHHLDFENEDIGEQELSRNALIWNKIKTKTCVLLSASLSSPTDYSYTLRDAINDSICCDYDVRVAHFDEKPSMKSIAKYICDNPMYLSILAYCNSIEAARTLEDECKKLGISSRSMSCEERKKDRREILSSFEQGKIRVLASVNTLGEGINIRCADTCLFAEPRSSVESITQCIGRVARTYDNKKMAHVVICTHMKHDSSNHPIIKILRALSTDDCEFVKKVVHNRSSRLRLERNMEDIQTEKKDTWLWDDVYDSMMKKVSTGNWELKFEMLKEFYKKNNRLPKQNEGSLGSWLSVQRQAARGKSVHKITEDHKNIMNTVFPDWLITATSEEAWMLKFNILKEFYEENKRYPGQKEGEVGLWFSIQRQSVNGNARKKMTVEHKNLMDSTFPKWTLTYKSDEIWYENLERLKEYVKEHGHLPRNKEGSVGTWLNNQRAAARENGHRGSMKAEFREIMEKTFPGWLVTSRNEEHWVTGFNKLKAYYSLHGKLPFCGRQKCEEAKFLSAQRVACKGKQRKITDEHKELMDLAFPGWTITFKTDEAWMIKFEQLKDFYEKNNCFPSREGKDKSLGNWLHNQRRAAKNMNNNNISNKISTEHKEMLDKELPGWL